MACRQAGTKPFSKQIMEYCLLSYLRMYAGLSLNELTYGFANISAVMETIFPNAFTRTKASLFWFGFHWSLFLAIQ